MRGMVFQKLGGKYQLAIEQPEDLQFIPELDDAQWMATSAPADSFVCDPAFLKYLDTDGNGRIRSDEIRNAWQWLALILRDHSDLIGKKNSLRLETINDSHSEGKALRTAAERILRNLNIEDKARIELAQVRNRQAFLASGTCNGDGVIPLAAIPDPEMQQLMQDVVDSQGSKTDAGGQAGVDTESLDAFLKDAEAFLAWQENGRIPDDEKSTPVMIWGENTPDAFAAILPLRNKIDEFFELCQLLKIDAKTATRHGISEKSIAEADLSSPEARRELAANAPLAKPNTEEILPLNNDINAFYRDAIDPFREKVLRKIRPEEEWNKLSFQQWREIKAEFKAYSEWHDGKAGASVEKIPTQKLKDYLGSKTAKKLRKLIAEDLAVAGELKESGNVEKLILYQQGFVEIVNNFISFSRLFDPHRHSMIQCGYLVLDGRHFDLCVKVGNRTEHRKIAEKSNICVIYLDINGRINGQDKNYEIAAAVTSGNMANLYLGKTGVFFSPDGQEWDARIVDFIKQPVSVSEALKMPFVKLGEFINKQVEKFTSSQYSQIEGELGNGLDQAQQRLTAPQAPAQSAPTKGGFGNTAAMLIGGGGVAIAALGSAFAYITNTLAKVSPWHVLAVIAGIAIIIVVPVSIAAWLKLRRRNIGAFMAACGWAINARMRLSHHMGMLFSYTPALPKDAKRKRSELVHRLVRKLNIEEKSVIYNAVCLLLIFLLAAITGWLLSMLFSIDEKIYELFFIR